ncbi:MAG: hypothetical protein N4A44_01700 [Alphaproteobacteria bacterium]|jgi:hypothetical protein|nr:hypothetical protein [Alphaproteobacteria bacterium]
MLKNINIQKLSNLKFIVMLVIMNLAVAASALALKAHSHMHFEEGGIFEVLTVFNYVAAMFFYKKKLYSKFSYLPMMVMLFLIDRELGFLRGLMTNNNIIEYKKYIDAAFILILLVGLIRDGKDIFKTVINSFKKVSSARVKVFAIGTLGILNFLISSYSEKNHMRYFEESLEFFVSALLVMLIFAYHNLLKEIKVIKK